MPLVPMNLKTGEPMLRVREKKRAPKKRAPTAYEPTGEKYAFKVKCKHVRGWGFCGACAAYFYTRADRMEKLLQSMCGFLFETGRGGEDPAAKAEFEKRMIEVSTLEAPQ